jgi:ParB family chromosome partitioning protein
MGKETVVVPIAKIVVGKRHRVLDQGKIDALAESIKAIGLQHPISVCPDSGVYRLVTGEHRLEAAKKLGWLAVEAIKITDATRELWEIDENLARAELSTDERREHLRRRKELWEKRQADAKEAENTGAQCANNRGRGRPKGFAAETAGAVGKSKSQINRLLAAPKVKGKLKPTRRHQTDAQKERDGFCAFVSGLDVQNDIDVPKLSKGSVDLLSAEEKAHAISVLETAAARLTKKTDLLRGKHQLH